MRKSALFGIGLCVVVAISGAANGCENDGVGPQGTVVKRVKPNKLVINDISKGRITITVGPFAFKNCSKGEKYPLCKTKF